MNFVAAIAFGANLAATSAESWTGATVPFCTSSPSQSWAPTMTSGPLPTLVASLNCARVSVATWTATLMPFSAPNWSAYFFSGRRAVGVGPDDEVGAGVAGRARRWWSATGAAAVVVVVPEGVAECPTAVAVRGPTAGAHEQGRDTRDGGSAKRTLVHEILLVDAQGASLRP